MKLSLIKGFGATLVAAVALTLTGCNSEDSGETALHSSFVDYVNPFIGTGGHGHTYPGASRPFGMVQLSPDTRLDGWDGCSGYHYSDSVVYGFSHTHLSGTGVSDYGDILLMPQSRPASYRQSGEDSYSSAFDKASEVAEPGYYAMHLNDDNIDVELTSTQRAGFHKYTFNDDDTAVVIIDLEHRDKVLRGEFTSVGDYEIAGYRISEAWATEQHVYFVAQFSEKIVDVTYTESLLYSSDTAANPAVLQAFTMFDLPDDNTLKVRVGISAVSVENARANLEAEITDWDFDKVRKEARDDWESELAKIEVEGGTDAQKEIFYTALYHSYLNPNLFTDVNGEYRGMDMKVHKADQTNVYTVFSLWDTFRGTHPLFTITQRERTKDFIRTFLTQYKDGGALPIWELAGNYTGCMIGYHSIPVIADAHAKGITDFDTELALEAMQHSAKQDHLGLDAYKLKGFISSGDEAESVSKTLEYAYDDWCIAQYAKAIGKDAVYYKYMQRAQHYKNLYDPNSGFLRAKKEANWYDPFDPAEVNFNYTEANAWQYSLFVPQDIQGLIKLMGGADKFEAHLDNMFSASTETSGRDQADITGLIGQYAHGNEPSHHMAYLYNYIKKPWKTQEKVRQIMDELYTTQPDGLSGNEDCGQMSSWYVLSAMGFYSVTPGSPYYAIGSPIFDKVTIHLENGEDFVIEAHNNSAEAKYVESMALNGETYNKTYLDHSAIMAGGTLSFKLSSEAQTSFGVDDDAVPPSAIVDDLLVPVPYYETNSKTFTEDMMVAMGSPEEGASILYTLDGTEPTVKTGLLFEAPIKLTETTTIKAMALGADGKTTSRIVSAEYIKIPGGRSIKIESEYAQQYTAGGDNALIDYQRGSDNFRTGDWQGYWDQDFSATVDLGGVGETSTVSIGFLQDIKSWIWFPESVKVEISRDGTNFEQIGLTVTEFPVDKYGAFKKEYTFDVGPDYVRYVRVTAEGMDHCPAWHLGAGNPTWIFIDEISIE